MSTDKRKEYRRQYANSKRSQRKAALIEHFGDKCADCGGTFHPAAYDFHHEDETTKCFEIAPALDRNWDTILEEVKKCVMLCSNCHRVRHYVERNPGEAVYKGCVIV